MSTPGLTPAPTSPQASLTALGRKFVEIDQRLTPLSIWRAVSTYRAASKARSELDGLAPAYYEAIRTLQDSLLSGMVGGPAAALATASVQATSITLSNILVVQQRWATVNALVDRKQTLALGVIALVIAVVALFLTVVPLVAECPLANSAA